MPNASRSACLWIIFGYFSTNGKSWRCVWKRWKNFVAMTRPNCWLEMCSRQNNSRISIFRCFFLSWNECANGKSTPSILIKRMRLSMALMHDSHYWLYHFEWRKVIQCYAHNSVFQSSIAINVYSLTANETAANGEKNAHTQSCTNKKWKSN